jgi:multidrug resistance efflux pump
MKGGACFTSAVVFRKRISKHRSWITPRPGRIAARGTDGRLARARSLNRTIARWPRRKLTKRQQHVANLDAQLSYATIRSPITGIVTDQYQYEGEFASAGGKLVTIADISTVIVKAPFSDTVAAQLKVGDTVSVFADRHFSRRNARPGNFVEPLNRSNESDS